MYFRKQSIGIINFVNNSKRQNKINLANKIAYAKRVCFTQSGFNTVIQIPAPCSAQECIKHLLLEIDTNNTAVRAYQPCQREAKESHRTTDVQHAHAWGNVKTKDLAGILKDLPHGTGQKISNPDRASVMIIQWSNSSHTDTNAGSDASAPPPIASSGLVGETVHLVYYHTGFTDDPPVLLGVCASTDVAASVIAEHKRDRDRAREYENDATWWTETRAIRTANDEREPLRVIRKAKRRG